MTVYLDFEPDDCYVTPWLALCVSRCDCSDEIQFFTVSVGWLWWAVHFAFEVNGSEQ